MSARGPDPLLELVAYLVACARLTLEEAPRYGSFRLAHGASRLIEAAEGIEGLEVDDTLRRWKRSIDENGLRLMNDFPGYVEWLSRLVGEVAEETTRRNLRLPAPP